MKITVVGIGHVGLSLASIASKSHKVMALDIDKKRVDTINRHVSPITDKSLSKILKLL